MVPRFPASSQNITYVFRPPADPISDGTHWILAQKRYFTWISRLIVAGQPTDGNEKKVAESDAWRTALESDIVEIFNQVLLVIWDLLLLSFDLLSVWKK